MLDKVTHGYGDAISGGPESARVALGDQQTVFGAVDARVVLAIHGEYSSQVDEASHHTE